MVCGWGDYESDASVETRFIASGSERLIKENAPQGDKAKENAPNPRRGRKQKRRDESRLYEMEENTHEIPEEGLLFVTLIRDVPVAVWLLAPFGGWGRRAW